MEEVVGILVYAACLLAGTVAVLRWDDRRMTAEQRARAWTPSSRAAAIAFSVLCFPITLPVHFTRTRRSFAGFFLGLGFGVAVVVGSSLVASGASWIAEQLAPGSLDPGIGPAASPSKVVPSKHK